MLATADAGVVVCGHTHVQFLRSVGKKSLVNAGSVGMPYEAEHGAFWALLGPDITFRRTTYDLDAAAAAFAASGFPGVNEFIEETLRQPASPEEATAFFEKKRTRSIGG